MNEFEPSIGQAVWGHPYHKFTVPELMSGALMRLEQIVAQYLHNWTGEFINPFSDGYAFRCDTFGVWAYDWNDEDQPYNFKHSESGLEISWYKFYQRGLSSNMSIDPIFAGKVLDDCCAAVRAINSAGHDSKLFFVGSMKDVPYFEQATPEGR